MLSGGMANRGSHRGEHLFELGCEGRRPIGLEMKEKRPRRRSDLISSPSCPELSNTFRPGRRLRARRVSSTPSISDGMTMSVNKRSIPFSSRRTAKASIVPMPFPLSIRAVPPAAVRTHRPGSGPDRRPYQPSWRHQRRDSLLLEARFGVRDLITFVSRRLRECASVHRSVVNFTKDDKKSLAGHAISSRGYNENLYWPHRAASV